MRIRKFSFGSRWQLSVQTVNMSVNRSGSCNVENEWGNLVTRSLRNSVYVLPLLALHAHSNLKDSSVSSLSKGLSKVSPNESSSGESESEMKTEDGIWVSTYFKKVVFPEPFEPDMVMTGCREQETLRYYEENDHEWTVESSKKTN
jgi:hypothetical protein